MMKAKQNAAGMTLVEVLLAVAILGAGMAALLTASSRCLAAIVQSRDYQQAQWALSMGEADFPIILTNTIEDIEVSDHVYDNGCTFSRSVGDDEDEDGLYVVRSRVTWSRRGKEAIEEVTTYVYAPQEDE